jgi:hypothetical protein
MRTQERPPRRGPLRYRRQAVRLQDPRNRRAAHAVTDVLYGPLDPRVASRRILLRHPDHDAPDLGEHVATTGTGRIRPFPGDELTMPAQQRLGVTIVAISRSARRPARKARTARRRRSSSVRRSRLRPSCRRRSRFSSIRYASASRSRRSNQPIRTASTICRANASITAGIYITTELRRCSQSSAE